MAELALTSATLNLYAFSILSHAWSTKVYIILATPNGWLRKILFNNTTSLEYRSAVVNDAILHLDNRKTSTNSFNKPDLMKLVLTKLLSLEHISMNVGDLVDILLTTSENDGSSSSEFWMGMTLKVSCLVNLTSFPRTKEYVGWSLNGGTSKSA